MENECEALPGVAYRGVRDNRSTINTKTGYDDDDDDYARYCENSTQSKRQLSRNFSQKPRCHDTVSTVLFVNKHGECLLLLFLRE